MGPDAPPRPAAEERAQGVTGSDGSEPESVESVTSFLDKYKEGGLERKQLG